MKKYILLLMLFALYSVLSAQNTDFGFKRDLTIVVKDSMQNNLKNPWGGGLNSCQFSEIDLNMDGIKDLFVFDRNINKVKTFINNNIPDSVDYTYAPEYHEKFPQFHDWVELIDYNCDGKEDIFTCSTGGIMVYKNISNSSVGLKFTLITNELQAFQGTTHTNLYVSSVDFPAISDIDNDGDMDILAYHILGTYVVYYRNQSIELYNNCDSLDYILDEYCWGDFAENTNNNKLFLNITCPYFFDKSADDLYTALPFQIEHTGSTLLATDLNGDSIKDLLVSDVGFPNLIMLTNGGTTSDALMVSQDTMFPSNSEKINLISMPVPSILDINNDNKKDLIVSPFEGSAIVAENYKSCWMYKNTGTTTIPVFEYEYNNLLQKDMLETGAGAYPVLYDYDGDSLSDMFIANFGLRDSSYYLYGNLTSTFRSRIALYKNTGSASNPQFQFITNDFANLAHLKLTGIAPTFGDIDGDNASEMLIGKQDGKLDFYENTALPGAPMNMVFSLSNYMSIDVGDFSTPQLIDIDNDSLLDLIIGEKKGNLNFYKNTGTITNPQFTFITDSLGSVDVVNHNFSNYGYSIPCFFKNPSGQYCLFVGSESGYIYYYKDIDNNLAGNFTLADTMLLFINEGMRSAISVRNINNDLYPDMIVGNFSGGVAYFKGIAPTIGINEYKYNTNNFELFPNPANDKISIKPEENLFKKQTDINIYNTMGACVFSIHRKLQKENTIDISKLSEGLYILTISGFDKESSETIILTNKFYVIR